MFANPLLPRLSGVIYPVMILAGALWGATGRPTAGLIGLVFAVLLVGARRG